MYQLAIEDVVSVPVKFTANNGGKGKSFNFNLICTRLSQDELEAEMKDKEAPVTDVLKRIVTGWENQNLVVDSDKKPVDFSEAAFAVMLTFTRIHRIIWESYLAEVGAKEKK